MTWNIDIAEETTQEAVLAGENWEESEISSQAIIEERFDSNTSVLVLFQ